MTRHIVISTDCHAFGPGNGSMQTEQLDLMTEYFEPRYRASYENFANGLKEVFAGREAMASLGLFDEEATQSFADQEAVSGGGTIGMYDSDRRVKELEDDGIVAEVLFPNGLPFQSGFGREIYPIELRQAGARAYNRWLSDFCAREPQRRAGLAAVTLHDIDADIAEVAAGRDRGLKGVDIPTSWTAEGIPSYLDERYDPFWSACAELQMPVHVHGGASIGDHGDYGVASMLAYATETVFVGSRPFTLMVWGGVFERHPELTLVITENKADWVPARLAFLDQIYEDKLFRHIRTTVKHKPSEYWTRQCFIAASFMSRDEALMRADIGLDKLMWGADYPHYEGTWPHSAVWLDSTFGGLPANDVKQILAENPARVYGFDLDSLRPFADRCGPSVEELEASNATQRLWRW
jgi:predicted TIM-barrel fold metal-dependent hydrolase